MKKSIYHFGLLFLLVLAAAIWIPRLAYLSEESRLDDEIVRLDEFRRQPVGSEIEEQIRELDRPGELLAVYWLESGFGTEKTELPISQLAARRKRWERSAGWSTYLGACQAIWDDLTYFPVASAGGSQRLSVSFADSWMYERSYKGERGHEGTDIMPSVNERGLFPVVSMTDGVIQNMGWLELGGWRIGIRAPGGAYFYYAHLDSYADLEEGDEVKAGDLLGYMGDTGYSTEEGTKGKFPVHLHLGIYLYQDGQEISVNPYAALKYVQDRCVEWKIR